MEKLYGIVGEHLSHTYSPQIHREILNRIGKTGHYGIYEIERQNLCNLILSLKTLGYVGVNVTIPYKTDVMKYLDDISTEAKQIGAINVIGIADHKATGYNTDYYGFGRMLEHENIDINNSGAVVLGTGGASKAVVQYLSDNGIGNLFIVSRDKKTAEEKYKGCTVIDYDEISSVNNCKLVINCTPVGMYPNINQSPIETKLLAKFEVAVDVIYNPKETVFLREAKNLNLKTVTGMYMLVAQAVKAQEIWQGISIDDKITNDISNIIKVM